MPWVYALAFVVLGWAVMFLWVHPAAMIPSGVEAQRVDQVNQQVQALTSRVNDLAARPTVQPAALASVQAQVAALAARRPAAPDLSDLERRIAALEQHAAMPGTTPSPDLTGVQQRLAMLEQQVMGLAQKQQQAASAPDGTQARVTALGQQVETLGGRMGALASVQGQMSQLAQHLDRLGQDQQALGEKVQSLASGQKDAESGLNARLDGEAKAIEGLRGDVQRIDASLGRASIAARAQAALVALQAGRPLGAIQDAPAAVARFATEAPPTTADLRRDFPAVASAALAASQPADTDSRFLDRVWNRAQNLVTVRQGDRVIVGDPAAGVIARARDDLDAGDLAGAVDALSTLTAPAAQAVAGWLTSARAVVAARTALLGMAGQG